MASQKLKSARAIAVEVLNRCDPKKNYAGTILDGFRHQTDQSQRATDLVFGTLRNRRAIDTVIATFSGRPVERIQAKLLNIIRVGTYELIYCPSTEQYAIVNEAVLNAKAAGADKQAGFVNAVLRQITRHISNRLLNLKLKTKNLKLYDASCTLPQSFETGCQFDTAFLPDSQVNPAEYLSTVFSLPEWLVAGWLDDFGEESTGLICFASNRRPSVYLRPNRLRTTIENLAEKLGTVEVEFEIVRDAEMIRIKSGKRRGVCHCRPRDVTKLPGFTEGLFTVQDITAAKPVRNLENFKLKTLNLKLLDLCAAPGTKTTQLAEATGDSPREIGKDVISRDSPHEIVKDVISRGEARIVATDIDNKRLEMVKENIARLDIKSVDVIPYEEHLNSESRFDCILLDVPCSNTGVLARRVEARYRINQDAIKKLLRIQAGLLETAAGLVRPAGLICYSTCSIQRAENSELIENFLKKNKSLSLETEQLTLPSAEGFDQDGGYFAILAKH
jgi:16S rRNA (cytosine967-C5)-methyltransferase